MLLLIQLNLNIINGNVTINLRKLAIQNKYRAITNLDLLPWILLGRLSWGIVIRNIPRLVRVPEVSKQFYVTIIDKPPQEQRCCYFFYPEDCKCLHNVPFPY